MSYPLVLGLFDAVAQATSAARAAHALGLGPAELSVVAGNHEEEGELARTIGATPGAEIEDSRPAGRLGELGAYLLAAVAVGAPGVGSLLAAGPLSAEFGEMAGHVAGDLSAVLVKAGMSEDVAREWEERVAKGAILLAAHAARVPAASVAAAFQENGASAHAVAQWG